MGKPRNIPTVFANIDWAKVKSRLAAGDTAEEACAEFAIRPVTIKVSIDKDDLKILDRYRERASPTPTIPDLIRTIVQEFVDYVEPRKLGERAVMLRTVAEERKEYIRVPFDGVLAARIGDPIKYDRQKAIVKHEGTGLCLRLKCIRQQIVSLAIDWFIQGVR